MTRLDYECPNNHRHERTDKRPPKIVKCPDCGERCEIIWMAPRSPHQQFSEPIVMWRYSDGKLGVAGGTGSKTPKNADRIEITNRHDYDRYVGELNRQHGSADSRKNEAFLKEYERQTSERRGRLSWLMANESDPTAKEIYREALNRPTDGPPVPKFSEYFSEAMEYDSRRNR